MTELELLQLAIKQGGAWYAVAMAVVVVGVRAYRHPAVQTLLPVAAQWSRLPKPARWGIVFGVSALAAWVTGLLAGQPVWVAAAAAVMTALGSIGGHKATKLVGHTATAMALRGNVDYAPSRLRSALDVVVPIDRKAMERASIRSSLRPEDARG